MGQNNYQKEKEKMSTAASILLWELGNMWGHVSTRTPNGDGFLLRHLRPPDNPNISPDEVLEYTLDGDLISGKRDEPDEIFFYTYPYKLKKNVGAVVHCHPEMALALVAAGRKIVPIHLSSRCFGAEVPVAPWLYGIWPEHGEQATRLMGDNCALMIKNHGSLVIGETLEEACINTVQLERTAKMILLASSLGEVSSISPAVVKQLQSIVGTRSKNPRNENKSLSDAPLVWRYYEAMIKRGERWRVA